MRLSDCSPLPIEEVLRAALLGQRRLLPLYFACRLGLGTEAPGPPLSGPSRPAPWMAPDLGLRTSGTSVSGSSARGSLPSARITAVGCSSAAGPISCDLRHLLRRRRLEPRERVLRIRGLVPSADLALLTDRASSWAASRTTAIDSVSRRSRREASISLAEATSMFSITSV